ncbi:hypothetical protein D9M71_277630 [compost metagenome]
MAKWPQQLITHQLEVLRGVFAKRRKHAIVGHDRRRLREQVVLEGFPEQAQGLEVPAVAVIAGKIHLPNRHRNVQPKVLDKAGRGDEAVEQRGCTELALDLVIETRASHRIGRQRLHKPLGRRVVF